jgi:hypothetical protein
VHCSMRPVLQVPRFHARDEVSELLSERSRVHSPGWGRAARANARKADAAAEAVRATGILSQLEQLGAVLDRRRRKPPTKSRALCGKKSLGGGAATLAPSQRRTLYET